MSIGGQDCAVAGPCLYHALPVQVLLTGQFTVRLLQVGAVDVRHCVVRGGVVLV